MEENNLLRKKKYQDSFSELVWIDENKDSEKEYDIYQMLKFLEGITTGDYLDYLDLYLGIDEKLRLGYDDFLDLHKKMEQFAELSVFTREELLDILAFSLILPELEKTPEFKKRAWVYNTESLVDAILMHDTIFPSMKRFTKEEKKFLCLVLESLQFSGFFGSYRNNIAYNISDEAPFLKDNMKYFDLSFLMFICRLAGKFGNIEKNIPRFTSGFYSYLNAFKKDLLIHIDHSVNNSSEQSG
ncbi:MAG: hypothetical protein SP4CHLAM5_00280 [Chlamydiia bacterium]|nr:hypothetical protein [Chlamydiia bacterium]